MQRHGSTSNVCAGNDRRTGPRGSLQFKERLLPPEDSAVLEHVLDIAGKTRGSVKIYDLSKVADNVRALRRGIFRTPVVMIDGERYDGFENISCPISAKVSV